MLLYKPKTAINILLIIGLFSFLKTGFAQTISINELMASNAATHADEDGDYEDWIEIYNYGEFVISLDGFGLSDNYSNPFKWTLPEIILEPGEYLLIWASGKNRSSVDRPPHTNFSISAAGEEILLTNPAGFLVDHVEPVELLTDISIGRVPNGQGNWRFFTTPTPGLPNEGEGYGLLLGPVNFSQSGGVFSQGFDLSLDHNHAETEILYTIDGSFPDDSSMIFSVPIPINDKSGVDNDISMIPTNYLDIGPPYYEGWQPPLGNVFKINVIRARAWHPDAPPGPVSTHAYLVHSNGNLRYSLPWLSLSTNPEYLFDDDIGIYVPGNHNNYFQEGIEWERPANLSMFETDGTLAFNEDIGVRLHGNTTRSRPRKSLRINARADYGNSWINYQLFPEKNTDQYKRFILRNSGNDWDQATFRDAFMQSLFKNLQVETQYFRPSILFINGEYWGIHNIRDRYNHHYILARYGIEENEMTILENNADYKFGNPAGRSHYVDMRSFIGSNNMASTSSFDYVKTMMDVESFTDFQIANIFVMNTDWPGNNTLMWRYLTDNFNEDANERDGRWRWFVLDTDFGFGLDFFYVPGVDQGAAHNTLNLALAPNGPSWPNPPWATLILRKLLDNKVYRNYFINRFADLLNTTFSTNYVITKLDSIQALLEPEMEEHINRWRRPTSMNEWLQRVMIMRNFAIQRPGYLRSFIQSEFNIPSTVKVQINIEQQGSGQIQVNTIKTGLVDTWEGVYFLDIPVKFKAIAEPGYRFIKWSGNSFSLAEEIELAANNDINLIAHFEPSDDFQGDTMNPPAYRLANGPYSFSSWDENNPEGSFPPNMIFQQSNLSDPLLHDEMIEPYHVPSDEYHNDDMGSVGYPYRLTRRTRLNGLNSDGISFINTGRERDLGAAVLAIDTRDLEDVIVSWTASTIQSNSRAYAIQLQYRIGHDGAFKSISDTSGNLIEYYRSAVSGGEKIFDYVRLPDEVNNKAYVQLRWKYYFTGQQLHPDSGQRDELRLDDIKVSTLHMGILDDITNSTERIKLGQNFPNPFSRHTTIDYQLFETGHTRLDILNFMGEQIATIIDQNQSKGQYTIDYDGSELASGMYFYRLMQNGNFITQKMLKIK